MCIRASCCITRQTDHGLQHITQLGTGNYNEKTARLYTDLSFITADPTIGRDAVEFFRNLGLENTSDNYDILWVAPLQIKPQILEHIEEQMALARAGRPCGLFFKTNSVTDKDVIEKLAEASQAGVDVYKRQVQDNRAAWCHAVGDRRPCLPFKTSSDTRRKRDGTSPLVVVNRLP